MPVPVSVIVPVKNEAENLRRCLPALAWADEVFVVDSQSTDETPAVAAEHGATVVPVPLQRDLPQEEELGPGEPAVPQRVGPDRRRRRGRRPRAGRGDRAADRGRRGGRLSISTRGTTSSAAGSATAATPSAGTCGSSSTGSGATRRCPTTRAVGAATTRPTSTSSSKAGPPAPERAGPPRLPDDRRLGREAQPLRDLGGRAVRAAPGRADPRDDRPGPAVQAPAQEDRLAAADAPAGPLPLRLRPPAGVPGRPAGADLLRPPGLLRLPRLGEPVRAAAPARA